MIELLRDVRVSLAPVARADAEAMVRQLRTFPLLDGFRGAPPADVPALVDLLVRLSWLISDLPSVIEAECNPVIVHPRGLSIVDGRIRVAAVPSRPTVSAR